MGLIIQGSGQSSLSVEAERLVISLPRQVFGKSWIDLASQIVQAIGHQRLIAAPQRVMTQRGTGDDAPRWKQTCLDVLSWLLFLLKVPPGHELVALWQAIDWAAINQICAPFYHNAHGGQHAWAPAQMVALLVLMFLYGVPHETTVLARVKENIVWCWFCGFGLFGPWPDHCALYDFRQRVGAACFEEILTLVVQTCLEAGLVSNELLSFDLTPVVASGHRWSPYERAVILTRALIRYLELSWAEQRPAEPFPEALRLLAAEVALEVLPHKALDTVQPERVVDSVERWTTESEPQHPKGTRPWQVEVEAAVEAVGQASQDRAPLAPDDEGLRPRLVQVAKALLTHLPHTRGDADARVGRTTSYTWFCGYLLGFAVDSAYHIITAVVVALGNVKQCSLFRPVMDAHRQRVGDPKAAALDSAFDDPDTHAYLDQGGIVGHVTSRDHTPPADGGYGTDRLEWGEVDAGPRLAWILRCPNGTPLAAKGKARQGRQTYVGTACDTCPLYEQCCPKGQGEARQFSLEPVSHRRWQENRQHCQTEEYKMAQGQRFVEEGRFGLAKTNHHGAKAPYRSQAMNETAGLMIAIVMNYRVLARHQAKERRVLAA
jgi:transposase